MAKNLDWGGWIGPRKKVGPTQTVGGGGTTIWGGYIESREKDSRLQGEKRYVTYSDLLSNVSIVAASVRWYLNLVAKVGWKVEPAERPGRARISKARRSKAMSRATCRRPASAPASPCSSTRSA